MDDTVCLSINGTEHVEGLMKFLETLTTFDLRLAPKNRLTQGYKQSKYLDIG